MKELKEKFLAFFGHEHQGMASAPGRVNLIGEHTDYNNGFVLPCALDFRTWVAFSPRNDNKIKVIALDYANQEDLIDLGNTIKKSQFQWANYVRGMIDELQKNNFKITGANLLITGNVPQGAGLSSSAALEVAVGAALLAVSNLETSPTNLAFIAQAAENNFLDCQCGIMDQLISATGVDTKALLIDCKTLTSTPVSIPKDLSIVIIDSGTRRELVDSEYNARRASCESAAKKLGVESLREINMEQVLSQKEKLNEVEFKRARHVVGENQRTLDAVTAMESHQYTTLFELLRSSHLSLKNDYEVTIPEIDSLFTLCNEILGDSGATRMTGGGFGGSLVSLVKTTAVENFISSVTEGAKKIQGINPKLYVCSPAPGLWVDRKY